MTPCGKFQLPHGVIIFDICQNPMDTPTVSGRKLIPGDFITFIGEYLT